MSALRAWEVEPGLWRWQALLSPCSAGDVVSTYCETDDAVVLVDPVLPDAASDDHARFFRALDRDVERLDLPVVVIATCERHARDAEALVARYRVGPGATASPDAAPASVRIVSLGAERVVSLAAERLVIVPSRRLLIVSGHVDAAAARAHAHDGDVATVLSAHDQR